MVHQQSFVLSTAAPSGAEPSGLIDSLTNVLQRALAWTGEQAFRLPPAAWAGLVVVSVGMFSVAIAANADWSAIYLAAATVAITATPLGRWFWLKRPGLRSSVVLARFGDEAGTHPGVMAAHLAQLQRRLAGDGLLGEVLEIRTVNAAVNPRAARRILRHTQWGLRTSGQHLDRQRLSSQPRGWSRSFTSNDR